MSVAKRGDGRFVVKFKDEEGRWKQRSFRTDEEARIANMIRWKTRA